MSKKKWNDRVVVDQIETNERILPKVPAYRRKNGEEVKATLFTNVKKNDKTSKERRFPNHLKHQDSHFSRINNSEVSFNYHPSNESMIEFTNKNRSLERIINSNISLQNDRSSNDTRVKYSPNLDVNKLDDTDQPPRQLFIDIKNDSYKTDKSDNEISTFLSAISSNTQYSLKKLSHIGRGSTSTVYKSFYPNKFEIVAEKVVSCSNDTCRLDLLRELKSLRSLLESNDHRKQYIVNLIDVIVPDNSSNSHSFSNISICLEYMQASLQDIVDSGGCTQEIVLSGIARQMLLGLSFIHEKRFLHRDFKPVSCFCYLILLFVYIFLHI